MMTVLIIIGALLLDRLFAEPRRYHPLVGFGRWASWLEAKLYLPSRYRGMFCWGVTVLPIVCCITLMSIWLDANVVIDSLFSSLVLYLAIGWQSLFIHGRAVATPLLANNINAARQAVAMIVSRDVTNLDSEGVSKAATESMLENGADAIFAVIFWFCIAGIPGVILYRLSNTLDAMWGYKNNRYLAFGWAAARIDDILNLVPARLTALSYVICGNSKIALQSWRRQAATWKSPNAGPVMAAGAGALNVSLGGQAPYDTGMQVRPTLGPELSADNRPNGNSILLACQLVNRSLILWVFCIAVIEILLIFKPLHMVGVLG